MRPTDARARRRSRVTPRDHAMCFFHDSIHPRDARARARRDDARGMMTRHLNPRPTVSRAAPA